MVTTSLRKRNKAWPLLTFLKLFTKKKLWIYLFVPQQIRWNQMSRLSFSRQNEMFYISLHYLLILLPNALGSLISVFPTWLCFFIFYILWKNSPSWRTILILSLFCTQIPNLNFFYSIQYYHSTLVFMIIEPHERIPTYLSTLIYYYHSSLYSSLHAR